jgi:hypothetical protein
VRRTDRVDADVPTDRVSANRTPPPNSDSIGAVASPVGRSATIQTIFGGTGSSGADCSTVGAADRPQAVPSTDTRAALATIPTARRLHTSIGLLMTPLDDERA